MPVAISPFHVHLIRLRGDEGHADDLYDHLRGKGYEILYDDRDERPGVKFNDADLIGIPLRLTIGKRSLQSGGAELKLRRMQESEIIPLENLTEALQGRLNDLRNSAA
jgi:prolyl-tRNA synthetase